MLSTDISKSAPTRSILLMNASRGTLYLVACRQTVSDCGCTPATPSKTAMRTVEHAKRALDFRRKINVTRRVDDIDALLNPSKFCKHLPLCVAPNYTLSRRK
jgi:hypothetical protein